MKVKRFCTQKVVFSRCGIAVNWIALQAGHPIRPVRVQEYRTQAGMEKTRIIGYRAHPEFSSLVQSIYECGHAFSTPLAEFRLAGPQEKRCTKCVTGAPADISPSELSQICSQTPASHPLIGRLASALFYHLSMTEKRQYLEQEARPDLDEAVSEARLLLEQVGYQEPGFSAQPMASAGVPAAAAGIPGPATEPVEVRDGDPSGAPPAPDPAASGIYYFELPDLSLL